MVRIEMLTGLRKTDSFEPANSGQIRHTWHGGQQSEAVLAPQPMLPRSMISTTAFGNHLHS
jgi:hypothetical protein